MRRGEKNVFITDDIYLVARMNSFGKKKLFFNGCDLVFHVVELCC